jgi:hypothetical protein
VAARGAALQAAQKVAALKQQRASLEKSVYRIARMDI